MLRKLASSTLVVALAVVLGTTNAYAGKPAPNQTPVVTVFDVATTSPSPVQVITFTATDADGTITGYLITETPTKPSANAGGWTLPAPTQYITSTVGMVTLYGWAKDDKDAVSNSLSDSVTIPAPAIDADTLDGIDSTGFATAAHDHDSVYRKKYANVVVVAKSGGDFTDPIAAMDSITNASEANPYLVKIMPGVYDLGSSVLWVKSFVDVEGAGETATTIAGSASYQYLVTIPNQAEVRFLTVESSANDGWAGVIANSGLMTHVTATATGAAQFYTVDNRGTMKQVSVAVTASGGNVTGINNWASLKDVTVTVTAPGGTAIASSGNSSVMNNVHVTMISPGDVFGIACSGTQSFNNVVVSVSGGNAYGIYSNDGNLTLNNATINAVATGGFAFGINHGGCDPTMTDVTVNASAAGSCYALANWGGITALSNVTAIAKNGTSNIGMYTTGMSSIRIDRSTLEGTSYSLFQEYANTPLIGSSKLVGSVGGAASYTCVASYNGSYQLLSNTCQ